MTDHDDAQLDAALETLACPEPGPDHVAQVLARTSRAGIDVAVASRMRKVAILQPRWVLPMAATVVAAVGLAWQAGRGPEAWMTAAWRGAMPVAPPWTRVRDIERPVLPPQAYWGMDAFEEFARLRPGARPRSVTAREAAGVQATALGHRDATERLAWVPVPSGLPLIEVESIVPAALDVPPLAPPDTIAVAEIPIAPIVVETLIQEERP